MSSLVDKSCEPCSKGTPPLKREGLKRLKSETPGWTVVDEHHLCRKFTFPDFSAALTFVNRIGAVAEQENHHPDIALGWGRVEVTTYTHSIGGLSENDFILAAKIDRIS